MISSTVLIRLLCKMLASPPNVICRQRLSGGLGVAYVRLSALEARLSLSRFGVAPSAGEIEVVERCLRQAAAHTGSPILSLTQAADAQVRGTSGKVSFVARFNIVYGVQETWLKENGTTS